MLLVLIGGSTVALIWMALLAKDGSFAVLFSNLTPTDAAEARVKLAQMGIDARLENGGATIKVPSRRLDEATMMLALEGIPSGGSVGFELMDKSSIGQSKFQQEKNYHRMREGELARTLLTLQEVERARVHLALPDDSLFVKDQKSPTASVVLKLRRGQRLAERQLNGIVHLVSHSVEGMAPENVSIIDSEGNLLNSNTSDSGMQFTASQAGFKTGFEEQLKTRIESMLENIVGKGRVAARVTADFDFASLRQVSEKYDPEGQVVKSEQTSQESTSQSDAKQGGTGSDSNLPGAKPASSGTSRAGETNHSDVTKEYALSREWKETSTNMPVPKRVSVALLVDGIYEEVTKDGKKAQEFKPRSEEEVTKLQELVKAAMGYTTNEERQDLVTVECLPFKVEEPDATEAPWLSYHMRQLIEMGVTWGVVGLIGILLIFMVLKPAVSQILVSRMPEMGGMLPAGAAGMGDYQQGGSSAAMEAMRKLQESLPPGMELPPEALAEIRAMEGKLGEKDRAFNQMLQMNQLQAKSVTAQAQKVHQDVIESAKSDPHRTVSLMRQWMDEA
jgi:flagellar M-ring protein FliF